MKEIKNAVNIWPFRNNLLKNESIPKWGFILNVSLLSTLLALFGIIISMLKLDVIVISAGLLISALSVAAGICQFLYIHKQKR